MSQGLADAEGIDLEDDDDVDFGEDGDVSPMRGLIVGSNGTPLANPNFAWHRQQQIQSKVMAANGSLCCVVHHQIFITFVDVFCLWACHANLVHRGMINTCLSC